MHDLKFLNFSLQLGFHLAMMCNGTIQSDLLQRITSLRKAMARDLEIFIPEYASETISISNRANIY